MWVIIWSNDSTDPSVYGLYNSEDEANRVADEMRANFDHWDKMKDTHLYVEQLLTYNN